MYLWQDALAQVTFSTVFPSVIPRRARLAALLVAGHGRSSVARGGEAPRWGGRAAGRARTRTGRPHTPAAEEGGRCSSGRWRPRTAGLPNIQARGAVVLDEDGHELYARNPDKSGPIASISKLAATLVVVGPGPRARGALDDHKADIEVARAARARGCSRG